MGTITLEVEGRRVEVDESFRSLSAAEQETTIDEIASSLGAPQSGGFANALNQGTVRAVGGLIDALNPFDEPHSLNPFPEGTGSAVDGINNVQRALGIKVDDSPPQGLGENAAFGAGAAIGGLIPAAKATQAIAKALPAASSASPAVQQIAQALSGRSAPLIEAGAGAITKGAEAFALEAGASPETAATIGMGAGAIGLPGATWLAQNTPLQTLGRKAYEYAAGQFAPFTNAGGEAVARATVQGLAGGPQRAAELAERLGPSEIWMTPAQQMQEPNLVGLESVMKQRHPEVRERLDQMTNAAPDAARSIISDMGGDTAEAQRYFGTLYENFAKGMQERVKRVMTQADEQLTAAGPRSTSGSNSVQTVDGIRDTLRRAKQQEAELWSQIPHAAQAPTDNARAVAQDFAIELGRSRAADMPPIVNRLLLSDDGYGQAETVQELYGLYSNLREFARGARGGTNRQDNAARVADGIAEAILKDLGAIDGSTEIGQAINAARAYSAAVHETFSTGAVGRILAADGNASARIEPETALRRTVGVGGDAGAVASRQIQRASPASGEQLQDFLRGSLQDAAETPTGQFTASGAERFMRNNRETLTGFPELRDDLSSAVANRRFADGFANRADARVAAVNDPSQSVGAAFQSAQPRRAAEAVFNADDPANAARQLVRQTRGNKEALAGVKGAMLENVMTRATGNGGALQGKALTDIMKDPRQVQALKQVMTTAELTRLGRIANELSKVQSARAAAVDPTSSPNKILEAIARIAAANHGANLGDGFASLQTAQMASSAMTRALNMLQNSGANRILRDAVTDGELMKDLLTAIDGPRAEKIVRERLSPYLAGSASAGFTSPN